MSGGTVVARPPVLVSPENLPQGAKIFVEPGLADTRYIHLVVFVYCGLNISIISWTYW